MNQSTRRVHPRCHLCRVHITGPAPAASAAHCAAQVLDCNRNGLGYFPAAVFGIENSKTPNCTPEVRAATEGHRMYVGPWT